METWRNTAKRKELYLPLIEREQATFCVWDVETTGLNPQENRMIQFSAAKYIYTSGQFQMLEEYNTYIKQAQPLPENIVDLTGITDTMLSTAPEESDVVADIFRFINNSGVWVGYNLEAFDVLFLRAAAARYGFSFIGKPVIDVLELSRDFVELADEIPNHKLQTIAEHVIPGRFQFHNALDDVHATAMLLEHFVPMLKAYDVVTGDEYVHLEKAGIWNNPYKKESRIKIGLSEGSFGDIYYSLYDHKWGCKKTTAAKRLFNRINLADLEEQFMDKYARFGYRTIEDVGYSWQRYKRDAEKARKQKIS